MVNNLNDPRLPSGYGERTGLLSSKWAESHLRWMLKKDALEQDMFLLGGSFPINRWLAFRFCEMVGRGVEYISLTQDTTESDLKSRREIRDSSVVWEDQCVVRATMSGRVLVVEGMQWAERNVMPVLNNLLENREMPLDDGRFLIDSRRLEEFGDLADKGKYVSVHKNFRVIVLGLPSPPFAGNPLDPPLRSRFQARVLPRVPTETLLLEMRFRHAPDVPVAKLEKLLTMYESVYTLKQNLVCPGELALLSCSGLLNSLSVEEAFHRIFPWSEQTRILDSSASSSLSSMLGFPNFVNSRDAVVDSMVKSIRLGLGCCVVGDRGEGKSHLVRQLAGRLGYRQVQTFYLYKDMTSRDLFQRRGTNSVGETVWFRSPVAQAMIDGAMVVLDGLHRLSKGTISSLARVIQDREVALFDGTLLVNEHTWSRLISQPKANRALLERSGIFRVHEKFCIVALASPPSSEGKPVAAPFFDTKICSMFHWFHLPRMKNEEVADLIQKVVPVCPPSVLQNLVQVRHDLFSASNDKASALYQKGDKLSLRLVLRIACLGNEDLLATLENALLCPFMPRLQALALRNILVSRFPSQSESSLNVPNIFVSDGNQIDGYVQFGDLRIRRHVPDDPSLVPNPVFFDIPKHRFYLLEMARFWRLREHLLLIGVQGVGKNKLTDYFLSLLRVEREYIQLHRDSTVHTLTSVPSFESGKLVYKDSPLIQAMQNGRVLVIDEFDKAPAEVVVVLKGLLQDREIRLADGRLFEKNTIHPDFRIIALANKPGYPFLGNDFFKEMGDCFATIIVKNPDTASEVLMLKKYAPNVDDHLLNALSLAFSELRDLVDQNKLSYPYSTRELVNVVRHLEKFPSDHVGLVLENIFDFGKFIFNVHCILNIYPLTFLFLCSTIKMLGTHMCRILCLKFSNVTEFQCVQIQEQIFVTLKPPFPLEIWRKVVYAYSL